MKQAKRGILLALAVMVMMVFAVGGVQAEDKVIKVGITAPLTGPSAIWGQNTKASVEMAFEAIDYKIGDYKFELVWIDSQSDPAKATNAFSEAVERKGITVAFWDIHSSVSVALMDVVSNYKIPLFFPLGAATTINKKWLSDPEKYSYFGGKAWPDPAKLSIAYVECINDAVKNGTFKPKTKKVAIYGEDNDWGRSFTAALKKGFETTGWEIATEDYFPSTQVDFYPTLSKYKQEEIAVVAGTFTPTAGITGLIKQAREIGLESLIIADQLGGSGDWYEMVGTDSNGVLDMIPQLATPEAKKWAEGVDKKYGFKPAASSGGQAFDYANFFIKVSKRVLERFNKIDREGYYKVLLEEVNTGKLTYSEADGAIIMKDYMYTKESMPDPVVDQQHYYFPVLQYWDGKGYIVYPEDWKEKDLVVK